jgi:trans-2,3-dihydro-3-hydroxyanthranilate isomerase
VRKLRYFTCDVFTEQRFGGNPLAVLPEAEGLADEAMQQIAREFNFSETTFVFPPERGHTRKVRIFTPSIEVPFAGHPNVGTAFVLAHAGELGELDGSISVTFEERAGLVPVDIEIVDGVPRSCELLAPERFSFGEHAPLEAVAVALSLSVDDIVSRTHPPQVASVGFPFLFVELCNRDALSRARIQLDGFEALAAAGLPPDLHCYVRSDDDFDLRTRMFAPLDGVPEDPATGSANCALAAMLGALDRRVEGELRLRIAQGVEMGRPSVLDTRVEKRAGEVVSARIGGACVMVSEGRLQID